MITNIEAVGGLADTTCGVSNLGREQSEEIPSMALTQHTEGQESTWPLPGRRYQVYYNSPEDNEISPCPFWGLPMREPQKCQFMNWCSQA